MISLEERYKNFKSTIQEIGISLLSTDDENIEYNLFEEFSVDVISFLHEDTLNIFLDVGMIDETILEMSVQLRSKYIDLEKNKPELFNVNSVRVSEEWKIILELSDNIEELL